MPKLTLKYGDRVIHEYGVEGEVTIGRLPDNTIVIDNPAVSGRHARLFLEEDRVVVEDLRSKNGTYVNEQHVVRAVLNDRDVLLIGKHKILFSAAVESVATAADGAGPTTMGPTAYLDTKQHRAMLAKLREARAARERVLAARAATSKTANGSAAGGSGVLRVLAGGGREAEYRLQGQSSLIGKSDAALVRLRGLFKPRVAATIHREDARYFLEPAGGHTLVNGQRLDGRHELRDGDVLDVSGLVLEFRRGDESEGTQAHPHVA
jgi:pSer/pThr/pTyr-binding forkhead associated (FHA) protein